MADSERRTEIRVGLFVVLALGVMGYLTLRIAGSALFAGRTVGYEVAMTTSGGVRPGDAVRLAGVEVGRVRGVELAPGEEWPVVFRVELDEGIRVSRGASARIAAEGLLGGRFLEIDPGSATAPELPPGGRIEGHEVVDLTAAVAQVGELASQATVVLDDVSGQLVRLMDRIEPLLGRAEGLLAEENVAAVSATLGEIQGLVQEARPQLAATLQRVEAVAASLEEGTAEVPRLTAEITGLAEDLRRALGPEGERLATLLERAESTLGAADGTFSAVDSNRGEVEAAVRDLRQAAANLRALSQELKQRPSSLLGLRPRKDRKPGEGVEP